MATKVEIPELGESITEAQIGSWRKSEGDTVEQDETLVEMETDKTTIDLPAPASGRLAKILKKEGETVSIGDVIAEIDGDGEDSGTKEKSREKEPADEDSGEEEEDEQSEEDEKEEGEQRKSAEKREDKSSKEKEKAKPARDEEKDEAEEAEEEAEDEERDEKKSAARKKKEKRKTKKKEEKDSDEETEEPEDQDETREDTAEDEEEEEGQKKSEEEVEEEEEDKGDEVDVQPRVMPAAREALKRHNLRPEDVKGTGPGGRILPEDVEKHAKKGKSTDKQEKKDKPRREEEDKASDDREKVVPMSPLRRRIAQRLVEVQQTAALLTTFNEVDMSSVIEFRQKYGAAFERDHGVKLGFTSFFVRASIEALRRVPRVNAEIRGTDIIEKKYYDIGVAVSTEHGLMVPVIRDADRLGITEIETAIADLAERAGRRKIDVDELQGGSFTITNGGVFGSLLSTPIVNPPQCAILGMHTIQNRPIAVDGQVVIRPMMYIALTYDHRIIDGRESVTFLRHVKEFIESPVKMLVSA